MTLEGRLIKADSEYVWHDYQTNIKAMFNNYGFEFIANSGRALIQDKSTKKYFKVGGSEWFADNVREAYNYGKLRDSDFKDYFSRVEIFCGRILEVEYVEGFRLSDYCETYKNEDFQIYEVINARVQTFLDNFNQNLNFQLNDIHGGNIIYNPYTDKWKIIDYAD